LTQVAIVADDLTGAFDAAAPFAARGLATEVATTPAALDMVAADTQVVSLTTASRHLVATDAAAAVRAGSAAMARLSPALWFKKIDSTLRGNVAAELVAALAASGRQEMIVAPAVPAQGRTVVGGKVHVNGVPLEQTEFVHDAVSAASAMPLSAQLAAADPALVCRVVKAEPPAGEHRAWIADAAVDADLAAIAGWAMRRADTALLAGAAGLGNAIAGALAPDAVSMPLPGAEAGPILTVLGSRAAVGRRQAEALLARGGCEDWSAPGGRFDPESVSAATGDALLHVPSAENDPPPEVVAAALGDSVVAVLGRRHFATLLLTGGDTAAAVLAALGTPLVTLLGEVAPGVPLSRLRHQGRTLWLVTKAGGFGSDDLFAALPRLLGA
jgi:D-threonate/D-erythronate kinase